MAFTRIGLGGVLSFDNRQAVQAMGQTGQAFVRLTGQITMLGPASQAASAKTVSSFQRMAAAARKVQTGIAGVGSGLRNFAIAALPATLGLKKAVGAAADFEHQMQGVKAILKGVSHKEFAMLTQKAKEMGIQSVFSGKQSAQAMEFLARAGFNANEVMGAIDQTIFAAAAEEMNLADASRLVANNVRAFGLEAKEAGRVADVLALASARSNTTMIELGEGLKYSAPFARMMGVDIEDAATALGLLADAGLQGSIGGTALKNALIKLAAPSSKGAMEVKKLGLIIADANGDFVGLENILKQLRTGMNGLGGNIDRAAAASKLFGMRGVAITQLLSRLDRAAGGSARTFSSLNKELRDAKGSAEEMAGTRLDSLRGQLTLLKSSMEAAFIETFGPAVDQMKGSVKDFIGDRTSGLNGVLYTVQEIKEVGLKTWMSEARAAKVAGVELNTIQQIALGVMDSTIWLSNSWNSLTDAISRAGRKIKESIGGEGVRAMTSMIVKILTIVAIAGPLLLILGLLKMAIGGIAMAVLGLGKIVLAMFSPWALLIAAVVMAVVMLRDRLKGIASVLWENLKPVAEIVGGILKNAFLIVAGVIKIIGSILGWIFGVSEDGTKTMTSDWNVVKLAFSTLTVPLKVLAFLVDTIKVGLEKIVDVILWIPRKLGLVEEKASKTTKKVIDMAKRAGEEIGGPMMGAAMASQIEQKVGDIDLTKLSDRLVNTTTDSVAEGLKRGVKTADLTGMYKRVENMVKKGTIDGTEAGLAKAAIFYKQSPREYLARQGLMDPTQKQMVQAKHFLARGLSQTRVEASQLQMKKQEVIEAERRARTERLAKMSPRLREGFLRGEEREYQAAGKEVNVNIKNTTCIDGRAVSSTMAKHQAQIQERIGAKSKHWQTKVQREFGAAPGTVNLAVGS